MAHLADALPINKFANVQKKIKPNINGTAPKPLFFNVSAPLMARINPKLVQLK